MVHLYSNPLSMTTTSEVGRFYGVASESAVPSRRNSSAINTADTKMVPGGEWTFLSIIYSSRHGGMGGGGVSCTLNPTPF